MAWEKKDALDFIISIWLGNLGAIWHNGCDGRLSQVQVDMTGTVSRLKFLVQPNPKCCIESPDHCSRWTSQSLCTRQWKHCRTQGTSQHWQQLSNTWTDDNNPNPIAPVQRCKALHTCLSKQALLAASFIVHLVQPDLIHKWWNMSLLFCHSCCVL